MDTAPWIQDAWGGPYGCRTDVGCLGVGSQWIQHQRWEARGVSLWMQDNECGMFGEVPMDAAPGMPDAQGSLWVHT